MYVRGRLRYGTVRKGSNMFNFYFAHYWIRTVRLFTVWNLRTFVISLPIFERSEKRTHVRMYVREVEEEFCVDDCKPFMSNIAN